MAKERKYAQGTGSMGSALVVGTAVSLVVTLIGAVICAGLISAEVIQAGSTGYCAMAILLISAMAGATAAGRKGKQKRLYSGLLAGAVYFAMLLAMNALLFDGQYGGVGVTALIVLSGSVLPAMIGLSGGNGVKPRRSKLRHR